MGRPPESQVYSNLYGKENSTQPIAQLATFKPENSVMKAEIDPKEFLNELLFIIWDFELTNRFKHGEGIQQSKINNAVFCARTPDLPYRQLCSLRYGCR